MKVGKIIGVFVFFLSVANMAMAQDETFYPEFSVSKKQVQLYPNPATEYLAVKLSEPHAKTVKLAMRSVIGNVISIERDQVDEYEVRLQVRDLPTGYYFLSIKDEESGLKSTYKFLKR